jgi:hypothetical protein
MPLAFPWLRIWRFSNTEFIFNGIPEHSSHYGNFITYEACIHQEFSLISPAVPRTLFPGRLLRTAELQVLSSPHTWKYFLTQKKLLVWNSGSFIQILSFKSCSECALSPPPPIENAWFKSGYLRLIKKKKTRPCDFSHSYYTTAFWPNVIQR